MAYCKNAPQFQKDSECVIRAKLQEKYPVFRFAKKVGRILSGENGKPTAKLLRPLLKLFFDVMH